MDPNDAETISTSKKRQNEIEVFTGNDLGSPYLFEDFKPGKIYYDEEYLGDVYYRLNAFNNEIELKHTRLAEEKQKALIKDEKIRLGAFNYNLVYKTFIIDKDEKQNGYLNLIYSDKTYVLYEHIKVKYTEGKPAANFMVNPLLSRFKKYTQFLYQLKDSRAIIKLPIRKSKFLALFDPSTSSKIKKIIKTEDLDLNTKHDLLHIFKILNDSSL